MNTKLVKISDLKVDDLIVDLDGLLQIVKSIEPKGKKFEITTNYVESGFYKADDTTRVKPGKAMVSVMA